jgi:hypothetical protein
MDTAADLARDSGDCDLCADCMCCRRADHRSAIAHMLCRCSPGEGIFE